MSDGVLFKGRLEEGNYNLIKTTDGWVLDRKDIAFAGSDITDRPQEWIPCSEKLPEADGLYLATFTLIGIPKFSNVESFKNGKWEYHNGYIIAWMPLPKPWKGADDER